MHPPHSPQHPEFFVYVVFAAMFASGIYLFFKGFRVYWQFRLLRNIPTTAIRGLAMGLVRVSGRATGTEWLTSPVTRQPCFFYKLVIDRWQTDARGRGFWALMRKETDAVQFYLEDETGKVRVYLRGAELDLAKTFRTVFNGELPESLTFASTSRSTTASTPEAADPQVELIRSMALVGSGREAGSYRLTESCILPDESYTLTGTCAQNPVATDEADRNIIKQGTNDPTFVISDKGPQAFVSLLDLKALAYIFGGGILAVVGAALALLLVWTG